MLIPRLPAWGESHSMITNFSSSHELVEVNVLEHSSDRPILPLDLHDTLRETYDATVPLVMKLNGVFFTGNGRPNVPDGTLFVPDSYDITDDLGDTHRLWVLKGDRAKEFFETYV